MTNFALPLIVTRSRPAASDANPIKQEQHARIEILQTVINHLKEAVTPDNIAATEIVIQHYYTRLHKQFRGDWDSKPAQGDGGKKRHFSLRSRILLLEKDLILHMAEMGQLSESKAEHYIIEANRLYNESTQKLGLIKSLQWLIKHLYQSLTWKDALPKAYEIRLVKEANEKMMNKKQRELNLASDDPALKIIADEHEKVLSARMGVSKTNSDDIIKEVYEVAENGLYMERVLIQQMMEAGRLSRKTAKEMQANIILLEAQLHSE